MIINGKWMSETEITALISQLTADKKRLERQLEQGVKQCKMIPLEPEVYKRGPKKGQPKEGKVIEQECSYYADFDYIGKDGTHVVEDTKGVKTKEYIIKRKLMLYIHGIRISEI